METLSDYEKGMTANESGMLRDPSSLAFFGIDEAEWLRGWDAMQEIREQWEAL